MREQIGYVKLSRRLLNNPIFKKPAYLSVWLYLLLNAQHEESSFIWNNKKQILGVGQLLTGIKVIAKKTGIAQSSVYRILKYLENEKQIEQQKTTKFTVITILNWGKYQGCEKQNGKQMENRWKTDGKQMETYKNVNKNVNKNVKQEGKPGAESSYTSFIENFNSMVGSSYRGDTKSQSAFLSRLKSGYTLEDILKAVSNAKCDSYLMGDNPTKRRYLTPEYITRSDKLDQWLNNKKRETEVNILNQTK
jgi:uncharacterized phage protein (TIGR02220 family)